MRILAGVLTCSRVESTMLAEQIKCSCDGPGRHPAFCSSPGDMRNWAKHYLAPGGIAICQVRQPPSALLISLFGRAPSFDL